MKVNIIFIINLHIYIFTICENFHNKTLKIDKDEINILVLGDFGYEEEKSNIKKNVVAAVKKMNYINKFHLGLILGDNIYPSGAKSGDHKRTKKIFSDSFPKKEFDFDFLTVLGNHEYAGDIEQQIEYFKIDPRYYIPERIFRYDVIMKDLFTITFICVDSTPLLDKRLILTYDINDLYQINMIEDMLSDINDTDYLYLITHHNLVVGFGPHNEYTGHNYLTELLKKHNIDASIHGHNHNMQYIPPQEGQKTHHILVGNSAKKIGIRKNLKIDKAWYYDEKGGFGQLKISKNNAIFKYFNEDGVELKSIEMIPIGKKRE